MTKRKPKPTEKTPEREPHRVYVKCGDDENREVATAATLTGPFINAAWTLLNFEGNRFGHELKLHDLAEALEKGATKINNGNMQEVEAMLYSQGVALNSVGHNLMVKAQINLHQSLDAAEKLMKLALKAQDQSRRTFETLGVIKNPPAVFAKQANINNGGQQQVNNGEPAARAGNPEPQPNKLLEKSDEQWLDTGATAEAVGGHSKLATVGKGNRT